MTDQHPETNPSDPWTSAALAAERRALAAADRCLLQREEILRAFVAKYGFQPDEAVQVEQRNSDGTSTWRIERTPGAAPPTSCQPPATPHATTSQPLPPLPHPTELAWLCNNARRYLSRRDLKTLRCVLERVDALDAASLGKAPEPPTAHADGAPAPDLRDRDIGLDTEAADRILLKRFYDACHQGGGTVDEATLRGLKTVLARDAETARALSLAEEVAAPIVFRPATPATRRRRFVSVCRTAAGEENLEVLDAVCEEGRHWCLVPGAGNRWQELAALPEITE